MDLVEQIGSYAGFAAVVGLAVLAALYFSQARDVKRLREWAGRAPERTAQPVSTVQAQPQPKPAAAPAKPAAPAQPATKPPATAPALQPAPTPAAVPAATGAGAAAATATQAPPTQAPPGVPPRPPTAPRAPTLPPRSPVLPPATATGRAKRGPWHRRVHWPAPRYLALILVGVLVIGGGGAYGVTKLLEDEPAATGGGANGGGGGGDEGDEPAQRKPKRINPSTVTVSVLNGTTVPNLAARLGDEVQSEGFQRGNVANATELRSAKAESVVLYAAGAKDEARAVATRLDISQIERADPESQALAGNASVIVVAGADQTQ